MQFSSNFFVFLFALEEHNSSEVYDSKIYMEQGWNDWEISLWSQ